MAHSSSFFVVEYVPDLVSGKKVNIGILLHIPEKEYLACLFTNDFEGIKRFHPRADLEFLRDLQHEFRQQIDEHKDDLNGYLRYIQDTFSNLIQIAPPRTCLVRNAQTEIKGLFARYVGPA